jgi:hypothetical protein
LRAVLRVFRAQHADEVDRMVLGPRLDQKDAPSAVKLDIGKHYCEAVEAVEAVEAEAKEVVALLATAVSRKVTKATKKDVWDREPVGEGEVRCTPTLRKRLPDQ